MEKNDFLFKLNIDKLKKRRLELGLSLKRLSDILRVNFGDKNIDWRQIFGYENKEITRIPIHRLAGWACSLNLKIEDLLIVNSKCSNPLKIESYKDYFSRTDNVESISSSPPAQQIHNGLMFGLESLRHTENRGKTNAIYLAFDFGELEIKNEVTF